MEMQTGIKISVVVISLCLTSAANAELNDNIVSPNTVNASIAKTLEQQVGVGRGNINTPGSLMYIIKRDPFRSVRLGSRIGHN